MKNQGKLKTFLHQTAATFDLPPDIVAGVPRIELIGDGELRVENHRGILSYGAEEIHVSGGGMVIRVTGTQLELGAMTGVELLITGHITGITLD